MLGLSPKSSSPFYPRCAFLFIKNNKLVMLVVPIKSFLDFAALWWCCKIAINALASSTVVSNIAKGPFSKADAKARCPQPDSSMTGNAAYEPPYEESGAEFY